MTTQRLRSGRHEISLHSLRDGEGPPLLLLHALGGSSLDFAVQDSPWPGPIHALDLAGHGESDWLTGGGYYPELYAADVDVALGEIGSCHVVGVGLGAYVALLVAGARPDAIRGALLVPGRGGDGVQEPDIWEILERSDKALASFETPRDAPHGTDPMVTTLDHDARPLDYAVSFAKRATGLALVAAPAQPGGWWDAVARVPGVTSLERSGDPTSIAAEAFGDAPLPTGTTDG